MPEQSLLRTHRGGRHPDAWANYADCFSVTVPRAVTLAELIGAFYTSPLFRLERLILAALLRMPSTDAQVAELAAGSRQWFAAWRVAERTDSQILLSDFRERTRSWLAVTPVGDSSAPRTLLQFGSGVAAGEASRPGGSADSRARPAPGRSFRWLMAFHVAYSRALLAAAGRRLT